MMVEFPSRTDQSAYQSTIPERCDYAVDNAIGIIWRGKITRDASISYSVFARNIRQFFLLADIHEVK